MKQTAGAAGRDINECRNRNSRSCVGARARDRRTHAEEIGERTQRKRVAGGIEEGQERGRERERERGRGSAITGVRRERKVKSLYSLCDKHGRLQVSRFRVINLFPSGPRPPSPRFSSRLWLRHTRRCARIYNWRVSRRRRERTSVWLNN